MRSNPNDNFTPVGPWVKANSQVTVSIGRNVGNEPLSDENWAAFQRDVSLRLEPLLKPSNVFGPFTGSSEWEGAPEESAVVILLTQYTTQAQHVDALLKTLAANYGQEAIAWSFGPNLLAAP